MSLEQRQDELRKVIDEMMWGLAINAGIAQNYVELRDDVGLEYAVRQVVARAKVVRDVMVLMKRNKHEAELENEQRHTEPGSGARLRGGDQRELRRTGT